MRKLFLLTITVLFSLGLFAQEATFNEKFDTFLPEGWQISNFYYNTYNKKYEDWKNSSYSPDVQSAAFSQGSYSNSEGYWLVTPVLMPVDGKNTITFKYKGSTTTSNLQVKVSTASAEMTTDNFSEDIEELFDAGFTEEYQTATINLAKYNDQKIYIAFVNYETSFSNWVALDDFESEVAVYQPKKDAVITEIMNKTAFYGEHDIVVTIKNNGSENLTACKIKYSVNDGEQKVFDWTGDLAKGATEVVTIAEKYSFVPVGEYTISVEVELEGDEESSNNTKTKTVNYFGALTCPIENNFEALDAGLGWKSSGFTIGFLFDPNLQPRSGNYALSTKGENAYVFTRLISVKENETYTFSIWYKTRGKAYKDVKISYGKKQELVDLTDICSVSPAVSNDDYMEITGTFTPTETGDISICIQVGEYGDGEGAPEIAFEDMSIISGTPAQKYTVTYSVVNPEGGTLVAKDGETEVASGTQVDEFKNIVLTATPNEGWVVKEWTANGDVVTDNITNVFDIAKVTSDTTITVEFAQEQEVTFVVKSGETALEGATINVNNENLTTDAEGKATIKLLAGTYHYVVTKDTYENFEGDIEVTDEAKQVDIDLVKTGVNDDMVQTYEVMPNPFTDKLVLKGVANVKEISIYSVTGTVVYSNVNILANQVIVNTNDLKQGVYIIKVTNKQGKSNYNKVIKK